MIDWIANISVIATGFGTVLGVLTMLWGACAIIGSSFARKASAAESSDSPTPFASPSAGVPPEHVAAISAAVSTVMGTPHRIVHISAPSHRPAGWTLEGRFDSFGTQRMPWDRWPRVTTKSQRRKNR